MTQSLGVKKITELHPSLNINATSPWITLIRLLQIYGLYL